MRRKSLNLPVFRQFCHFSVYLTWYVGEMRQAKFAFQGLFWFSICYYTHMTAFWPGTRDWWAQGLRYRWHAPPSNSRLPLPPVWVSLSNVLIKTKLFGKTNGSVKSMVNGRIHSRRHENIMKRYCTFFYSQTSDDPPLLFLAAVRGGSDEFAYHFEISEKNAVAFGEVDHDFRGGSNGLLNFRADRLKKRLFIWSLRDR